MPETGAERRASRVSVRLEGDGECTVRHGASGARLRTSKPVEYGGSGGSFSSTDLLAAALGSCIATDLEPLAKRHGIDPPEIGIDVEKKLSLRPKRVEALRVRVRLPPRVDEGLRVRFERAAGHCLVRRSLDSTVRVTVEVSHSPEPGPTERA